MNNSLILVSLLGVLSAVALFNSSNSFTSSNVLESENLFKAWKVEYNKSYNSDAEHRYRFSVFQQNLVEIEELKKTAKHQVGLTMFSDLTKVEFKTKYTGLKVDKSKKMFDHEVSEIKTNLRDTADHRACIPPVKNQGQCGSCWTFSAVVAAEFALNCPVGQTKSSTINSLSEQQLVDCAKYDGTYGCNGGFMWLGLKYMREFGLVSEQSYPYFATDNRCTIKTNQDVLNTKLSLSAPFVSYYVQIEVGNGMALQTAAQDRVISIGIDASALNSYRSGVIQGESCNMSDVDHGVAIVGYGIENGVSYYLVRNSWGSVFGEKGYFKLERNASSTGMGCLSLRSSAAYPIIQVAN